MIREIVEEAEVSELRIMGSLEPTRHSIKRPHVVVFPYPAQGHINPLIEFSKRLLAKNLHVTFVTTETIMERMIQAQNGACRFHDIRIETISDGLPVNFDRSKDFDMVLDLLRRVGGQAFERLIEKLNARGEIVSCIVYDSFLDWVPQIASKFSIPLAFFWTQSCAVYSIYYHYHRGLLKVADETEATTSLTLQGLPPLSPQDLPSFLHPSNSYKIILRMVLDQFIPISEVTWILGNSFHELEMTEIESMESLFPIRTVGPLLPSAFLEGNNPQDTDVGAHLWKTTNCLDWLNTKEDSTVVYVSFGSAAVLSKEQIFEIAFGLKNSGYSFLWVMRPSDCKEEKSSPNEFPDGFLEETMDRGLVVPWCPQMEVLCHPSVGVFLTHGGWNSTLESLGSGVPVLVFPQWSDQGTNSKYIEDVWKTGIRLKKTEGGLIGREEVEKSFRMVMESERGFELRENALRWKALAKQSMMKGGSSNKNFDVFVEEVTATYYQCHSLSEDGNASGHR